MKKFIIIGLLLLTIPAYGVLEAPPQLEEENVILQQYLWELYKRHNTPYGDIYAHDNEVETEFADSGVANKSQVTIFTTDGESNLTTPSNAEDHITIIKAGKYFVTISIAASTEGGGSDEYGFSLWRNNGTTEFENVHSHRLFSGGAGDFGSITMSGICNFAVDDTIEVWTWNEDDTEALLIDDITLSITKIGE